MAREARRVVPRQRERHRDARRQSRRACRAPRRAARSPRRRPPPPVAAPAAAHPPPSASRSRAAHRPGPAAPTTGSRRARAGPRAAEHQHRQPLVVAAGPAALHAGVANAIQVQARRSAASATSLPRSPLSSRPARPRPCPASRRRPRSRSAASGAAPTPAGTPEGCGAATTMPLSSRSVTDTGPSLGRVHEGDRTLSVAARRGPARSAADELEQVERALADQRRSVDHAAVAAQQPAVRVPRIADLERPGRYSSAPDRLLRHTGQPLRQRRPRLRSAAPVQPRSAGHDDRAPWAVRLVGRPGPAGCRWRPPMPSATAAATVAVTAAVAAAVRPCCARRHAGRSATRTAVRRPASTAATMAVGASSAAPRTIGSAA